MLFVKYTPNIFLIRRIPLSPLKKNICYVKVSACIVKLKTIILKCTAFYIYLGRGAKYLQENLDHLDPRNTHTRKNLEFTKYP